MQHRSRDPESSWPDGDVRDRYALCALTGTAFSIICEFRANFELRASLWFSGLLLFLFLPMRFLSFFFPLPLQLSDPSCFAYQEALSAFSTFDVIKAHAMFRICDMRLVLFVHCRSCRRDCTSCTISYARPVMRTDWRQTKSD